jgi:tetratricopeptide (TPR) repeat protein
MRNSTKTFVIGMTVLAVVGIGCSSAGLSACKLHFDQGRYPQALANIEKAALEQPNSAEVQMWRARCLGMLERDEEAAAALTKAAELDVNHKFKADIDNTRVSFWSIRYNAGLEDAKAADELRVKCDEHRRADPSDHRPR